MGPTTPTQMEVRGFPAYNRTMGRVPQTTGPRIVGEVALRRRWLPADKVLMQPPGSLPAGFFQLLDLGQAQERDENLKWTKSLQEISETYAAYMIIIGDRKWTNLSHSCFDCSWIVFVSLFVQTTRGEARGIVSFRQL